MPKKSKKSKNSKNRKGPMTTRAILYKEDGQDYALVLKMLGGPNVKVRTGDGMEYIGKIRGKIQKRCRIFPDDYVLITAREFEDNKVDIIHKYDADEVRKLKKMGEIVDISKLRGENEEEFEDEIPEDEIAFDFEEI